MASLKRLDEEKKLTVGNWREEPAFHQVHVADCRSNHEPKRAHTIAWNRSGANFATAVEDRSVYVWALDTRGGGGEARRSVTLSGHKDYVYGARWDPNSDTMLATASSDKSVKLWDLRTGKVSATVDVPDQALVLEWSPDGAHLVVCCEHSNDDTTVVTLDPRALANKKQRKVRLTYNVHELVFSPAGKHLFATGARYREKDSIAAQGFIDVYDFRPGDARDSSVMRHVRKLWAHPVPVQTLAVTPHCEGLLASGGSDCLGQLWSLRDLACVQVVTQVEAPIVSMAFSHDGAYLATAMDGASVTVCDSVTGAMLHKNEKLAALPTPDQQDTVWAKTLATAVAWHPSRHVLAAALEPQRVDPLVRMPPGGHQGHVRLMTFSPLK